MSIDASNHWSTAFGGVPVIYAANPGLHQIEREAVRASDAMVTADYDFATEDWAGPGKNHGTLNKWNN